MQKKSKVIRGFTLIEILVVIGIIAVLATIVLIAINPARQFAQANNTQRTSNVETILNAIGQNMADNKGVLPAGLTAAACPTATPCNITGVVAAGNVDLCPSLVTTYVASLPVDPSLAGGSISTCNATYTTGYKVSVDASNRVTVYAPSTQIPPAAVVISITR